MRLSLTSHSTTFLSTTHSHPIHQHVNLPTEQAPCTLSHCYAVLSRPRCCFSQRRKKCMLFAVNRAAPRRPTFRVTALHCLPICRPATVQTGTWDALSAAAATQLLPTRALVAPNAVCSVTTPTTSQTTTSTSAAASGRCLISLFPTPAAQETTPRCVQLTLH
jgi:hypothetical protein